MKRIIPNVQRDLVLCVGIDTDDPDYRFQWSVVYSITSNVLGYYPEHTEYQIIAWESNEDEKHWKPICVGDDSPVAVPLDLICEKHKGRDIRVLRRPK